jgi:hypothetical protein
MKKNFDAIFNMLEVLSENQDLTQAVKEAETMLNEHYS